MNIEVALLISILSVSFAFYTGISALRRASKIDNQTDASEMTTVIVKLENISVGITEIKTEMSTMKADVKDLTGRLIIVEQSAKQAHRRLDTFEKLLAGGDKASSPRC